MTPLRRVATALAAAAAASLLFACAPAPSASSTATAAVEDTQTPTLTPSPTPAQALSPLRGTVVPESSITKPALAAEIDNHWDARPQWGLERTDLVEGGPTRYVAVWHSDVPDEIGPIRSIRPMDPDIISPLVGVVAYSGGAARWSKASSTAPTLRQLDARQTQQRVTRCELSHGRAARGGDVGARGPRSTPRARLALDPAECQNGLALHLVEC
ncbi:MAG: DUF3048 domain-containing protein [Microbacterium sp.]